MSERKRFVVNPKSLKVVDVRLNNDCQEIRRAQVLGRSFNGWEVYRPVLKVSELLAEGSRGDDFERHFGFIFNSHEPELKILILQGDLDEVQGVLGDGLVLGVAVSVTDRGKVRYLTHDLMVWKKFTEGEAVDTRPSNRRERQAKSMSYQEWMQMFNENR